LWQVPQTTVAWALLSLVAMFWWQELHGRTMTFDALGCGV
jgi:hypothetical protein